MGTWFRPIRMVLHCGIRTSIYINPGALMSLGQIHEVVERVLCIQDLLRIECWCRPDSDYWVFLVPRAHDVGPHRLGCFILKRMQVNLFDRINNYCHLTSGLKSRFYEVRYTKQLHFQKSARKKCLANAKAAQKIV